MADRPGLMPSSVRSRVGWFDRFAERASRLVSRASFFVFAVALVLVWLPSYLMFRDFDTWQLAINTPTTIGTWLLVALLQNAQRRSDQATQHKLNALAEGLSEVIAATRDTVADELLADRMRQARRELCSAVGLEERESA